MTTDALLIVGRDAGRTGDVARAHARRIENRGVVDAAHVALYDEEPVSELRAPLREISADVVYAVPAVVGHTHETRDAVARALSHLPGEARYCEPPGRSPALTEAITDRAAERADTPGTLILVGFGSSSLPHQRQVVEYHATRLRDHAGTPAVVTCYLLQNPAVECARYSVTTDTAVAVPLFLAGGEPTDREIPEKLELDRGGIAYADPLGEHPRVTDALADVVDRRQSLVAGDAEPDADVPTGARHPVATDGRGQNR